VRSPSAICRAIVDQLDLDLPLVGGDGGAFGLVADDVLHRELGGDAVQDLGQVFLVQGGRLVLAAARELGQASEVELLVVVHDAARRRATRPDPTRRGLEGLAQGDRVDAHVRGEGGVVVHLPSLCRPSENTMMHAAPPCRLPSAPWPGRRGRREGVRPPGAVVANWTLLEALEKRARRRASAE
jgi:hypothetical protein